MSEPPEEFYSEERWGNWIDRLREADIDPEDEDSARLLLNLQDDVSIAVAKILRAAGEQLEPSEAMDELTTVRDIVLDEPDIQDEETALMIDGVQTSLLCVFYSAERYITGEVADDASIDEYLREASAAEAEEDLDRALGLAAEAGTLVIEGEELDMSITEDLEYGLVTEWINGLDSLQSAMADPEVIEE